MFTILQFLIVWLVFTTSAAPSKEPVAAPARGPANFGSFAPTVFTTNPHLLQDSTADGDPITIAKLHASNAAAVGIDGLSPSDSLTIRVASSHVNKRSGVTHVYLQQALHGLDIMNGVANVNVDKEGRVVSMGNSFFRPTETGATPQSQPSAATTKLSTAEAVAAFGAFLNSKSDLKIAHVDAANLEVSPSPIAPNSFSVSGASFAAEPIKASLKYIQTQDGASVKLVWRLRVPMAEPKGSNSFYTTAVDAETGDVLSLFDMVSDARSSSRYNVLPFGINDPDRGDRKIVRNPANPKASPFGWHSMSMPWRQFTDTRGNNVLAQSNPSGGDDHENQHRPEGGRHLNFDFPIDFTQDPTTYVDAAITNLFYMNNMIHDFYYVHGFDEESGNFQTNNFGKGGVGNDAVIAFAQDGSGLNNANFQTPEDGGPGIMRMYIFDRTDPRRDGDFDNGVIVHEYSHGLSNRLTGGPANAECLPGGEAGGMGEGWGDILATVVQTTDRSTREDNFAVGEYLLPNSGSGIRNFLYSTSLETNPSTYAFLGHEGYEAVHVHHIGEVWAVMLYEVYWNLVDEWGFTKHWFNPNSHDGNIVFVQLLIDGMKLQPCFPNFVQARDAILQADELGYNGIHKCAIWRGLAKRGLGLSAVGGTDPDAWNGVEAFDLPADCE